MILTDDEIDEMQQAWIAKGMSGSRSFARAVEAALLAKLAVMELPFGDDIEAWLEVRSGEEIATAFRQAFAQGAASQLSAEPAAHFVELEGVWVHAKNEHEGFTTPLFTRKEPY